MFGVEVKLGRVLGRGGFCVVNEIQKFDLEANSPLDKKTTADGQIIDEEEDELQGDTEDTNTSNSKRKKRKYKSDPLAQAKQEAERRRTEQQEVITQKAQHQANESEKQHQRKVRAKKRMQRTKKGQPIMKNVIGDLLGKIKSDTGG